MKSTNLLLHILVINFFLLFSQPINAQIIPDSTLESESSTIDSNQTIEGISSDVVSGGAVRGTNLFHSFQEFNVVKDRGVYFANPNGVQNILTRVTGQNPSNISGVLGVLGEANFFFLNPNGIIFSPNARLDINGSFLATTATSINLSDGSMFSARELQPSTLLTVNVPIGLSFIDNPGSIQVQGTGHELVGSIFSPVVPSTNLTPTGLELLPGHTFALVGGDITFTGGIANTPSGRIEIGSVASGQVSLSPDSFKGFSLNYSGVQSFKDISFERQALLNASGLENGNIQVFGKNITLTDSSLIFIENQGFTQLGSININALDSFTIIGITPFAKFTPNENFQLPAHNVISQTHFGKGADINIVTKQLLLKDIGLISLPTFGLGFGGNLTINASESINITGDSRFAQLFPFSSAAGTSTLGSGTAGDIKLTTRTLNLNDGGSVISSVFNDGIGGNLILNVSEDINLVGSNPVYSTSSTLSSVNLGSGQAGDLVIDAKRLILQNGAEVNSSTFASGAAGNININLSDSVIINGTLPNLENEPSAIISSAKLTNPAFGSFFGLPSMSQKITGSSGNITINTNSLDVTNSGQLTVSNDGTKNAGTLRVNASSINLSNDGSVTAATASGEGGNIFLRSQILQLFNGSNITTDARGGSGNGGNININSDLLTAFEKSNITANAIEGQGGNIEINAQGIFLSPDSGILASSQFGINGTVQINTPFVDFARATSLPVAEPKPPKFSSICQSGAIGSVSEFINVGTGGIPASSSEPLNSSSGWKDNAIPTQASQDAQLVTQTTEDESEFIEAQGWKWNPDGTLSMTLEPTDPVPYGSLSKSPCQQVHLNSTSK